MRYEVYDLESNKKITQDYNFILKPNGRIAYNEIGLENIAVLFYPTDNEHLYIDEVGGYMIQDADVTQMVQIAENVLTLLTLFAPFGKSV